MPTPWVGFWLASKAPLLAAAGHCLVAASAIFVVVRAARSAMPWPELGLLTATATFLVLPYAFNYDMAVVGLAAAMLLFGRSEALGWLGRTLALIAFAAPILVFPANWLALPLLPLALLGFLFVQARAYAPRARKSPEAMPRGSSFSATAEA
jgi:hypothetical protein